MNIKELILCLRQNKTLFKHELSLNIEELPLTEQKDIISQLIEYCDIVCSIKIADKSTEASTVYFSFQNDVISMSIGHVDLRPERKSRKKESGVGFLMRELVESIMRKTTENLRYTNKSLLGYTLEVSDRSKFILVNGTWNKQNKPLPERYSTIEKIFELMLE